MKIDFQLLVKTLILSEFSEAFKKFTFRNASCKLITTFSIIMPLSISPPIPRTLMKIPLYLKLLIFSFWASMIFHIDIIYVWNSNPLRHVNRNIIMFIKLQYDQSVKRLSRIILNFLF